MALEPVVPKDFPFTIRLTSQVLESNGRQDSPSSDEVQRVSCIMYQMQFSFLFLARDKNHRSGFMFNVSIFFLFLTGSSSLASVCAGSLAMMDAGRYFLQ